MTAMNSREFRNALGRFATGVTVITSRMDDGTLAGLTCNSFAAVSLDPPLVLWSLGRKQNSLVHFEKASHFAVNVLGADQMELSNAFAKPGDKFDGVTWERGPVSGQPFLPGCLAHFECRQTAALDGGDHIIFLGQVEHFAYGDGEPLLFYSGRYGVCGTHPDL